MILQCFTVYDMKTAAYLSPFFARSKGEAMRSFIDTCLDVNHPFHKHPDDYRLCWLGEFDDATGVLYPYPVEVTLTAFEVLAKESANGK